MSDLLEDLLDQNVSVLTNDGRNVVGTLQGVDQMTNIILMDCHERVYDRSGTQKVQHDMRKKKRKCQPI